MKTHFSSFGGSVRGRFVGSGSGEFSLDTDEQRRFQCLNLDSLFLKEGVWINSRMDLRSVSARLWRRGPVVGIRVRDRHFTNFVDGHGLLVELERISKGVCTNSLCLELSHRALANVDQSLGVLLIVAHFVHRQRVQVFGVVQAQTLSRQSSFQCSDRVVQVKVQIDTHLLQVFNDLSAFDVIRVSEFGRRVLDAASRGDSNLNAETWRLSKSGYLAIGEQRFQWLIVLQDANLRHASRVRLQVTLDFDLQ